MKSPPDAVKAAADRAAQPKPPPARDSAIKAAARAAAKRAKASAALVKRIGRGPKAPR